MELVPVTTVGDAGLANMIVGLLEQAGVKAVASGSGAPDVYPLPSIHPYSILVHPADVERARDVLAQYETVPDDLDDDE
jgi:hypothetical protein